MPAQTVIKLRRDTAADWVSADPTLAEGELGIELDTGRIKIGDGVTEWTGLAYGPVSDTTVIKVKNASNSAAIPAGRLVQFAGAAGDTVTVAPAVTDGSVDFHYLVGITSAEIAADGFGDVVLTGVVSGLNTSSYTTGTLLYADPANPGQLTSTAPAAPAFGEPVAAVTRSGSGTSGLILVRLNIGSSLADVHDVALSSPSSGQVLQFDGTKWVNADLVALPDQTGNSGKYLTTDGTDASWAALDIPPGTQVSETAPSSPEEGQMWWNSATGTLYIYYDATWVEAVTGVVGPAGADGADGEPGVVAATAPITYDAGTQTVGIDQSGLTLAQSQITGLSTALDGKADTVHTHAISDITGLVSKLSGRIVNITRQAFSAGFTGNNSSLETVATIPVSVSEVGNKILFAVDMRITYALGSSSSYADGPQQGNTFGIYLLTPGGSAVIYSDPLYRDYLYFNGAFYATDGNFKFPDYERWGSIPVFKFSDYLITPADTSSADYSFRMRSSDGQTSSRGYAGGIWIIELSA